MIFANHAHLYPREIRDNADAAALIEFLDETGIERAVAFAPFPHRLKEENFGKNHNEWLYNEIKNESRLVGFGTVDFEKDVSDEVRRIASYGFKGIKLHPQAQEFVIDGEQAFSVYSEAEKLGLFISFHTGIHWHRLRDSRVILFDEVAWNFPALNFSMEHIGGYHFFNEALGVMVNNSRREPGEIFAGWTTIRDRYGKTAWALTDEQLETVILQTGEDHSIFGIDFPFCKKEDIIWDIERIRRLNLTDECKENILGKTLEKVLGL